MGIPILNIEKIISHVVGASADLREPIEWEDIVVTFACLHELLIVAIAIDDYCSHGHARTCMPSSLRCSKEV